jgi:hypothetical protein
MLPESRFAKSEGAKIEFPFGSGVVTVTPQQYLTRFALPNFYFHVTTAYDIFAIWACQSASAIFSDRWRTLPILKHEVASVTALLSYCLVIDNVTDLSLHTQR